MVLGKFTCVFTALPEPCGLIRLSFEALRAFLAPWLWYPKSCCISEGGVPLVRQRFSKLLLVAGESWGWKLHVRKIYVEHLLCAWPYAEF